jgi:hypothetical protein
MAGFLQWIILGSELETPGGAQRRKDLPRRVDSSGAEKGHGRSSWGKVMGCQVVSIEKESPARQ